MAAVLPNPNATIVSLTQAVTVEGEGLDGVAVAFAFDGAQMLYLVIDTNVEQFRWIPGDEVQRAFP
jgi:hypothetical protein